MSRFSRAHPTLQDVFPSSGREQPRPNEVSEFVQLVHPFPGRGFSYLDTKVTGLNTATALAPSRDFSLQPGEVLDLDVVAQRRLDRYTEIVGGDISHDSATARLVQLFLISQSGIAFAIARWAAFATIAVAGSASGFEPLFLATASAGERLNPTRPVIIPPGYRLRVVGDTAAAAYQITLTAHYVVHPFAEGPIV